jgi:tetratricopeptide (TPR) repeat protein
MKRLGSVLMIAALLPICVVGCSGTEGRKARYQQRGEDYFRDGNLEKARVEFSNVLQIDPNNAEARYYAGRIAEKQVKPRDAVANYEAAIEANKDYISARGALGRIYLLGGLPDRARAVIEPGLAKAPDDAQLRTVRGGLRALEGDLVGAVEDGEVAVKADPQDEVALAFLAAQYSRQKRDREAIDLLQRGVKDLPDSVDLRVILAELLYRAERKPEAIAQLESLARRKKAGLENWQRLARLHLLEKNPDAALSVMREAVVANPGSIEAKSAMISLMGAHKGVAPALQQMQAYVDAEPENAELRVALGQFHEAASDTVRAEAVYREVIKAEGVSAQGLVARNRLAAVLVQKPDADAANALISEVLKESPRDNDALILRAGMALTRGDATAAVTDLRSVLRDQPTATPIMRMLARAHMQANESALAEETLRTAVLTDPTDVQSRFDLAVLLSGSGRANLAAPILEQLVRDAPDNVRVREAQFRVQAALSDFAGARVTAEELKKLRPDLPIGALLLGTLLEKDRKFAEAAAEYESALRVATDSAPVLTSLVRIDMSQRSPERAVARLQAVLEKKPGNAAVLNLLGEVHLAQKQAAKAVVAFSDAIAAAPAWWAPYRGKAMAQVHAGQWDLAQITLEEGLGKTSGSMDLYADLATVHQQRGQFPAAIAAYERALKQHPRALPIANNLALLLVNHGGDRSSVERAAKITELFAGSDHPALLDTLGWVKLQNGNSADALPLLQRALDKSPKSPEIRYHLGMAQLRSGNRSAARQSLQTALAAGIEFQGSSDARSTLATLVDAG